ncbi:capsular polysaccharide biosynthesis protein [Methylobacterium sp. BE186]|uniref:glycosyltransferase family 61 protein n=1 Tax=Methylobacterium sp. BE186 TaxID=2817715 RepID=UPI00285DFFB1|nr:glycosyltransferase family 61 protein [Methylobacterium sp. BE186]MDR7038311.1 capsular polysaccharide biosynthesis protein [Methylobacterium sp. BE186]
MESAGSLLGTDWITMVDKKAVEEFTIPPPAGAEVASMPCTNSYYAYPKVKNLHLASSHIASLLDGLWRRSVHPGEDVTFYHLKDVIVAEEGLVFDLAGNLISVTRTYHTDEEVLAGRQRVLDAIERGLANKIDKGILGKSRGADNYGHFLVEMLPRAWLARRILSLNDWPVIIFDEPTAVTRSATAALHCAGFSNEYVLPMGRAPVFVGDLIVVDRLTGHAVYLSPLVMECLDTITETIAAAKNDSIYVPRRPSMSRDFNDEHLVAERLQGLGFQEVETAALPFHEQVAAFKGASRVVGCAGAALTNIAFCRPGTDVFIFMPSGAAEVFFWMLAEARNLNYHEIRCREIGPQRGAFSWDRLLDVSPDEVVRLIEPGVWN